MLALAGSAASYSLVKNYTAENWMESFTVLDETDPTGGFVNCKQQWLSCSDND